MHFPIIFYLSYKIYFYNNPVMTFYHTNDVNDIDEYYEITSEEKNILTCFTITMSKSINKDVCKKINTNIVLFNDSMNEIINILSSYYSRNYYKNQDIKINENTYDYYKYGDAKFTFNDDKMQEIFKCSFINKVINGSMYLEIKKQTEQEKFIVDFYDNLSNNDNGKKIIELGNIYQRLKIILIKLEEDKISNFEYNHIINYKNNINDILWCLLSILVYNYYEVRIILYEIDMQIFANIKRDYENNDRNFLYYLINKLIKENVNNFREILFPQIYSFIELGNIIIKEYSYYSNNKKYYKKNQNIYKCV
jgi:hypothetical protein